MFTLNDRTNPSTKVKKNISPNIYSNIYDNPLLNICTFETPILPEPEMVNTTVKSSSTYNEVLPHPDKEKTIPSQDTFRSKPPPHSTSDQIDAFLEKEKQHNKTETWSKLDKPVKIRKLNQYAEKYAQENHLEPPEIDRLKAFFFECLEKNKLQKAKELTYNKDLQEIVAIPCLFHNKETRHFTLKNLDKKIYTLKSLTPKK